MKWKIYVTRIYCTLKRIRVLVSQEVQEVLTA